MRESLGDAGFSVTFTLQSPLGERARALNVGGRHNVRNAVAAAAAAVQAGATLDDVVQGLAAMQPVAGRLQPARTRQGAGSSTIPTTPIPVPCAPASMC